MATCHDAELSQLSGHSAWELAAVSTQEELAKFGILKQRVTWSALETHSEGTSRWPCHSVSLQASVQGQGHLLKHPIYQGQSPLLQALLAAALAILTSASTLH